MTNGSIIGALQFLVCACIASYAMGRCEIMPSKIWNIVARTAYFGVLGSPLPILFIK